MRAARAAVHLVRTVGLAWGVVVVLVTVALCSRTGSTRSALLATPLFVLCPQLLFASSTVGNDVQLVALWGLALLGMTRVLDGGSVGAAATTGVAAGLALWVKASALGLGLPLLYLGLQLVRRRRHAVLAALTGPLLLLGGSWAALNWLRMGSLLPSFPTGLAAQPLAHGERMLTEPWWLVSVWGSFWAKLGWFNLPLPRPAYLLFVLPTVLAVLGLALTIRRRSRPEARVLALSVMANLLLLVAYMVGVDWQPQGRYLLPSLPALAALASLAVGRLRAASPRLESILAARASLPVALAMGVAPAVLTLAVVIQAYQ